MTSPTTDRRQGLVGNTALKAPVTVLAAGNITLSGQQTIDGVAVLASNSAGVPDRVLCPAQTNPVDNGIWDVSTGSWTRSLDANGNYDFAQGSTVLVNLGTTYAGSYWKLDTSGSVTIGTTALAWSRALTSGLSALSFLQAGTGAVVRPAQDKMREAVSAKDFGAVGDGVTDDTAALQSCLDYCYTSLKTMKLTAGYYAVRESASGSGYALLNKGVSIVGEGRLYSQIVPLASMPNTADYIRVTPVSGAFIDYLELARFSIDCGHSGTKRGRHSIFFNFPDTTNLARLHVHDLYLFPGNDYSLKVENNNVINAQGVPANSVIERNMFWEGMFLNKIGDSITIRNNVLRTSSSSRCGVYAYISDTSGVASHLMIVENNFDCMGGAVNIARGRNVKVLYNNIELSAGAGTGSAAVIDIDGVSGTIPFPEVSGNHIGIFGTATASSAIRINAALGATVDKNTILAGITVAAAILLTSSAQDTDIGLNEIQSTYTTAVSNLSALRPMGVPVAAGMLNGFTNSGGGYQPLTFFKSRNGVVWLAGVVTAPATPSGLVIATLPTGYRPTTIQRFAVSTVSGGAIVAYAMEVDTAGNVVCYCAANTTRIEISASFQTTNYLAGSL